MIAIDKIESLVEEKIQGTNSFVVKITVGAGNKIVILLDNDLGTSIDDCIQVSRHVEKNLDREVEDFELQVMSPGVDFPLTSVRQYKKNVGRSVKVKMVEGPSIEGELLSVTEEGVVVKTKTKERIEGRKSKRWVEREHPLSYDDIKETKVVISFK